MTGPGANEGELHYVDWEEPDHDYWFEDDTEAQAQERMTPAEQQADIDWKQRWEAMVESGEINDPFGEVP